LLHDWHLRLGHLDVRDVMRLSKAGRIKGLSQVSGNGGHRSEGIADVGSSTSSSTTNTSSSTSQLKCISFPGRLDKESHPSLRWLTRITRSGVSFQFIEFEPIPRSDRDPPLSKPDFQRTPMGEWRGLSRAAAQKRRPKRHSPKSPNCWDGPSISQREACQK